MARPRYSPVASEDTCEESRPTFIVRGKTGQDESTTIGVAWKFEKEGKTCYKVALDAIPSNWDRTILLVPN